MWLPESSVQWNQRCLVHFERNCLRVDSHSVLFMPTVTPTNTPIPSSTPTPSHTPSPAASATIPPTPTPTSALPTFVMVFIPLNWSGTQIEFQTMAEDHLSLFLASSGISRFFDVQVSFLQDGLVGMDLTADDLVYDVIEAGLLNLPADRYIGLTNGDLAPDGESDVIGWTLMYAQGVVVEADEIETTAHELGHTLGLCDEYNYSYWLEQDAELVDGCPNPFPATCEHVIVDEVHCDGMPTDDGMNSIMGPGGLLGPYGYNQPSLLHLHAIFQTLAEQANP